MGLQPPAAPRSVNFRKFSGSGGFIRAQFGRGASPSGGEVYLGMATAGLGADKNSANKTPNRSASCTPTSRGMFAGYKFNHQSDKHKGDSHLNRVGQA
jgi:hypothetical protein